MRFKKKNETSTKETFKKSDCVREINAEGNAREALTVEQTPNYFITLFQESYSAANRESIEQPCSIEHPRT